MNTTDKETALAYWGKFLLSPHVNKKQNGFRLPERVNTKTNFSLILSLQKNGVLVSSISINQDLKNNYWIDFNGQKFELTLDEYSGLHLVYTNLYHIVNVTDIDQYL